VLQNNGFVAQTIFEDDEEALSFLRDIRYSELEGEDEGFTLTFHFAENPYFSNTTLSKTYHMEQDELLGELQYDHATGYSFHFYYIRRPQLTTL
jgi:nucleosome assembly protein 1-like 1